MSPQQKKASVQRVNIAKYLPLVERVAKVEFRRIPSHMVDYEELVSIGAIAIQALLRNKTEDEIERLNTSYLATATIGQFNLRSYRTADGLTVCVRTDITDASVGLLRSWRNLRYMDLLHTQISEEGHGTLTKELPNCEINWNLDATRQRRRT